jgi:Ca2+-binding RTX toxin-like protein
MPDIYGQDGQNDTLTGGAVGVSPVNDRLYGRTGDDRYNFSILSGNDLVSDTGGIDRIVLDSTVAADRVRLNINPYGGDLEISIVDAADAVLSTITIDDHFTAGRAVETLQFANGSTINLMTGLTIQGAVGDTFLYGGALADTLVASARNESFYGGVGNDTYRFGALSGSDLISDSGGTDRILFDSTITADRVRLNVNPYGGDLEISIVDGADQVLSSITVRDHFSPGEAVETLQFANGSTINLMTGLTVQGAVGDTFLYGGALADTLVSSDRDESFYGGTGNDSYRFDSLSGSDLINDTSGTDRILFDSTITADRVRLNVNPYGGDLEISIVDGSDQVLSSITVTDHFNPGEAIETLVLSNGSTIDLLGGLTVQGAVGDTFLYGGALADTLVSSARNESFYGGAGNDTYAISAADGFDLVGDAGGVDRLSLDASIAANRVRLDTAGFGDDLYVTIIDTQENIVGQITIDNHFNGQAVESLVFAGGATVNLLAGLTIQGAVGNTDLYGTAQADTIIGSDRDEGFYGGAGNDTYQLRAGFGTDLIRDTGGQDSISLTGVDAHRVHLVRTSTFSNTLEMQVRDRAGAVIDRLSLGSYFDTGSFKLETLRIGGLTFDIADQVAGPRTGSRDDRTGSFLGDTVIDGKGGNDRITDIYGSNTLIGGAGRDVLVAGDGADRLAGGTGGDRMTGGKGADTFVFARGTGRDVVTDFGSGADVLVLDNSLWQGNLTARQVVNRFATDVGSDVLLDFGARGEILLEGVRSLRGLAGDIDIV